MEKRKILITGKGSYVGISFIKWLEQWPEEYEAVEISVRGEEWKSHDFSQYDVVLHVAGMAHVSTDPQMEDQYYKVNRDLAIEVASKAKKENVRQFIFMSSIIVYGAVRNNNGLITINTIPEPGNFYGNSKLQAENGLNVLIDDNFTVVIIRPPMIYGKGSKGNYPVLAKFSRKLPFFPNIANKRSMLHIDNLSEFIRLIINHEEYGLFFPQNVEHVNTSEMVALIAKTHNRNIRLTKLFNPLLKNRIANRIDLIQKVFGNLAYELNMSEYRFNYQIRNFSQSIVLTETIDKEG